LGVVGILILALLFSAYSALQEVAGSAFALLLLAALLGLPVWAIWRWIGAVERRRLRALQMADVDRMTGHQFEAFVAKLLRHQDYQTEVTPGSGDLGVDVIARQGSVRWAIQTKRYGANVSRTAVSDAVAGMQHYRCNRSMVVTTAYFTEGAKRLAASTGCELVDRDRLAEWIAEWQDALGGTARTVPQRLPQQAGTPRVHAWDCPCGARNAPAFQRCHRCSGPISAGRIVPG
jgi:restriction system protein